MYEAHDVLLCIEQGAHIEDPDRRRLTPEHYFKSAAQMRQVFADLPEACDNTLVDRPALRLHARAAQADPAELHQLQGRSEDEALRDLARRGLDELRAAGPAGRRHRVQQVRGAARNTNSNMIVKMGFAGYFLIVADFIQWAKDNGVPVGPGRGSGAGSLVAWALKITDLDPLRCGLLFERFLNPERVSMPDFDIDFCQDRRDG